MGKKSITGVLQILCAILWGFFCGYGEAFSSGLARKVQSQEGRARKGVKICANAEDRYVLQ